MQLSPFDFLFPVQMSWTFPQTWAAISHPKFASHIFFQWKFIAWIKRIFILVSFWWSILTCLTFMLYFCYAAMTSVLLSFGAPSNDLWINNATSLRNKNGNEKLIRSSFFSPISFHPLLVVVKIVFTSPRIFMTFVCKCHCSIKASRLRRLPASPGIYKTSISCSFRLTRGTLQTLVCYTMSN